jgi:hypothetical protein
VTAQAPRAFNREMYHDHPENVFYGTDDGAQDGSFSEFAEIKAHYDNVAPERREDIHMISVVGGLYGLNLIPLWKPARLTIFDINPTAITYFNLIRRVLTSSRDVRPLSPAAHRRRLQKRQRARTVCARKHLPEATGKTAA